MPELDKPKMKIPLMSIWLGADPEFFFKDKTTHAVIGAEKVLPKAGIDVFLYQPSGALDRATADQYRCGKWVRDGVQVELQAVRPDTCRANMAKTFHRAFVTLRDYLEREKPNVYLSFDPIVEVPEKLLKGLTKESRVLGCEPSKNLYDPNATPGVDGETYLTRSAGGHIHLGYTKDTNQPFPKVDPLSLVLVLDAFVGNTCVLLDRSDQAKRRQVYGRAGEFREPAHGLEYRTLSNFWLRSPQLSYLAFGLARMAYGVVAITEGHSHLHHGTMSINSHYGTANVQPTKWDAMSRLYELVDQRKVRQAIDTNDFDLARENFEGLKTFIDETVPYLPRAAADMYANHCLAGENLHNFEALIDKGIDHYFPAADAMLRWCNYDNLRMGFEQWVKKLRPRRESGSTESAA